MSKNYEYTWAPGKGRSVSALVVGSVVELIQKREGGSCPPSALVDEARSESSPLHQLFLWDDSKAGELYRHEQARTVIRSIRIQRVVDTDPIPAFVSVQLPAKNERSSPPKRGYVETVRVQSEQDLHSQALSDCLHQLRGLQKRYSWLKELNHIWSAVEEALGEEDEDDV